MMEETHSLNQRSHMVLLHTNSCTYCKKVSDPIEGERQTREMGRISSRYLQLHLLVPGVNLRKTLLHQPSLRLPAAWLLLLHELSSARPRSQGQTSQEPPLSPPPFLPASWLLSVDGSLPPPAPANRPSHCSGTHLSAVVLRRIEQPVLAALASANRSLALERTRFESGVLLQGSRYCLSVLTVR